MTTTGGGKDPVIAMMIEFLEFCREELRERYILPQFMDQPFYYDAVKYLLIAQYCLDMVERKIPYDKDEFKVDFDALKQAFWTKYKQAVKERNSSTEQVVSLQFLQ